MLISSSQHGTLDLQGQSLRQSCVQLEVLVMCEILVNNLQDALFRLLSGGRSPGKMGLVANSTQRISAGHTREPLSHFVWAQAAGGGMCMPVVEGGD